MHPPISNIILFASSVWLFHLVRWFPGLSMFGASGITSFCLKTFCPFWCCLQLSMPTAPPNSLSIFSYDIQASDGQFRLEALVPTPSFSQLPLPPLFLCTQRHLIFRSLFLLPYAFRCGPAGSLSRRAGSRTFFPPTYFSHCQEFILFFIPL